MDIIHLSTVTPVYRGAETLRELACALDRVRQQLMDAGSPLQLTESIFVDDGSVDGSEAVLDQLGKQYDWIRVITLSRNFGQHPATIAGILHAGGDWVATLDEDLQHPPKYLLAMLRQAALGRKDVVYAQPASAVHHSWFRDAGSRVYKGLIAKLSGNPHVSRFNSFRMMRGSIVRAAAAVAGHQTYFDLALSWFTTRIGTAVLPLKDDRYISEGRSGYSFHSLLSHARRMFQSSELKMLRIGALLGVAAMLIAATAALYAVGLKLFFPQMVVVQGWASLIVAVLFLGGLNAFLVGLILEQLSLILMQTHGKPTFFEVDRRGDDMLRAWFEQQAVEP